MNKKILPCPFCGEIADMFYTHAGTKWGGVECGACGSRGPDVRTRYDDSKDVAWHQDAIKEWNERKKS